MKIWVCFWTYAPLHQWHLDVIMRAQKENDKCIVFVCGKDNDRWCPYWLPLSKRYLLVKQFFEKDEKITVILIDETFMKLDNSWSDENCNMRLSNAYNKIQENKFSWEITRYTWENFYKEILDKNIKKLWVQKWIINNPTILLDRSKNPISWKQCREDPLKYWDKIAYTFRGEY